MTAADGNYKNVNTILRYGRGADINGNADVGSIQGLGDAHQNFAQIYTVTSVINGKRKVLNGKASLVVAPPNVGNRVTPAYNNANGQPLSGATSRATLDTYTREATYRVTSEGTKYELFAGPA